LKSTVLAFGSGLWETVCLAKPTKEDKLRRKANKAQRHVDKERGKTIRREGTLDKHIDEINERIKNTADEECSQAAGPDRATTY
jgi:hypothetical protein